MKNLDFQRIIDVRLKHGLRNITQFFLDLKVEGYRESYSTLYRYVCRKREEERKQTPTVRYETGPGVQVQVDWGSFGKIHVHGQTRRLYVFVYLLGYSRMMYAEFTTSQDTITLMRCHQHAFSLLGITRTILYDNMKTVVLYREKLPNGKQKIHWNPQFFDFSRHFGFTPRLCHPHRPQTKGKVESGIKYLRYHFLPSVNLLQIHSIDELNRKVKKWMKEVANVRRHHTTKERPLDRWVEEKDNLRFPQQNKEYALPVFWTRFTTKDAIAHFHGNFYFLPKQCARRKVFVHEVRRDGISILEFYLDDECIAVHPLLEGQGKWAIDTYEKRLIHEKESAEEKTGAFIRPRKYYDFSLPLS